MIRVLDEAWGVLPTGLREWDSVDGSPELVSSEGRFRWAVIILPVPSLISFLKGNRIFSAIFSC